MNFEDLEKKLSSMSENKTEETLIKITSPLFNLVMAMGLCAKVDPKLLAQMLEDKKLISSYAQTFIEEEMKLSAQNIEKFNIDDSTKEKLTKLKDKIDILLNLDNK